MQRKEYLEAVIQSQRSPMEVFMNQQQQPEASLIVDVRIADKAFLQEKIAGALEISLLDLPNQLNQLSKDKTIYVTTWSGACTLAKQASIILLDEGYEVWEIGGGNAAWRESQLPMEAVQ